MVTFKEYMAEEKGISKWKVSITFLTGMFAGACLMFVFALGGIFV